VFVWPTFRSLARSQSSDRLLPECEALVAAKFFNTWSVEISGNPALLFEFASETQARRRPNGGMFFKSLQSFLQIENKYFPGRLAVISFLYC
jgi:hypothetical protein